MSTGWERATKIAVAMAVAARRRAVDRMRSRSGLRARARVPGRPRSSGSSRSPPRSEELQAAALDSAPGGGRRRSARDRHRRRYGRVRRHGSERAHRVQARARGTRHVGRRRDLRHGLGARRRTRSARTSRRTRPPVTGRTADDASYVWVSDYSGAGRRSTTVAGSSYTGTAGLDSGPSLRRRVGRVALGPGYGYVGWAPARPDLVLVPRLRGRLDVRLRALLDAYCHRDYLYSPRLGSYVIRDGSNPRAREYEATHPAVRRRARPSAVGGGRVAASPSEVASAVATARLVAHRGRVGGVAERRVAWLRPGVGPRPAELGIRRGQRRLAARRSRRALSRSCALRAAHGGRARRCAAGADAPSTRRSRCNIRRLVLARRSDRARSPVVSSRFDAAARAPQVPGVTPAPPRPSSSSLSTRGPRRARSARRRRRAELRPAGDRGYRRFVGFTQPFAPSFSQPVAVVRVAVLAELLAVVPSARSSVFAVASAASPVSAIAFAELLAAIVAVRCAPSRRASPSPSPSVRSSSSPSLRRSHGCACACSPVHAVALLGSRLEAEVTA